MRRHLLMCSASMAKLGRQSSSSIQNHCQLEVLGLILTGGLATTLSAKSKTNRMQAIMDMLPSPNRVRRRITSSEDEQDGHTYRASSLPHLQANIYRPRVQRIQQTPERSRKEGLLGRALHTVRNERDLMWMQLSENAEILAASSEQNERNDRERKGHW
jgi:hypothetical protein